LNPFQGTDLIAEANVRNTMQLMVGYIIIIFVVCFAQLRTKYV